MAECQRRGCSNVAIYTLQGDVKVCLNHKHTWLVFARWAAIMQHIPYALKKIKKKK